MKTIFSLPKYVAPGLTATLLVAGLSGLVHAASTEWSQSEGGRMRIVALGVEPGGRVRAGLQIEPKPGWITYWREPGASGIPPQITTAATGNVTLGTVSYPTPKHIDAGSGSEFGYDAAVTLPLDLHVTDLSKPAHLDAQAFIGLCKDICIPFQTAFSLPLDSKPDPDEISIVDDAATKLPEAPSADFSVKAFQLSADMKVLHLDLTLPTGDRSAPDILITGPNGYVFSRVGDIASDGATASLDMPIGKLPKSYTIAGKRWGILVKSGARAMETTLVFP